MAKNAFDSLLPDFGRMLRDLNPALEVVRRHQAVIDELSRNPALDALHRHQEAIRQLTENPVADAIRRQGEMAHELFKTSGLGDFEMPAAALAPFLDGASALARFKIHGELFDAAHAIAEQVGASNVLSASLADQFRNLIPDTVFAEAGRVAEAFRLARPDRDALHSLIVTTNLDEVLNTSLERFRQRAESIASDPQAGAADVEELVAYVTAVAAAAPVQAQAVMNAWTKVLLWWLLSVLAEDPVKATAHQALATFLIFLQTLQPAVLPEPPAPPALTMPAPLSVPDESSLPVLGKWQLHGLPKVVLRAGPEASLRTMEFFTTQVRNRNTRAAYANAATQFFNWCEDLAIELGDVTAIVVAAYAEDLARTTSASTVRQHLAALRKLFDWLVAGQVLPMNPASSVRGPRQAGKRRKREALTADQARAFLDSIDTSDIGGLRDRALIGVMLYTFARVSAVTAMRVEDYSVSDKRFRLHEKDGALHEVPAHHKAEAYVGAYLHGAAIVDDPDGPLFRTIGRDRALTATAMHRVDVLRMIKRRASAAGLPASTCCHTFRGTGIAAYLKGGGTLGTAQQIAAHLSLGATGLYAHASDKIAPGEIERIAI